MEEVKLPIDKATLLTHSRLRQYPDIQKYLAGKITPKEVTRGRAQEIVDD